MRTLKVLIVEDNPGDALIITEVLQDTGVPVRVSVAVDGRRALDALRKERGCEGPAADLVILDLNLPRIHGFDVLKLMKADDRLRAISVVVMTGSLRKEDEEMARALGAADYFIKPATAREMEMSMMHLRGHLESLQRKRGWDPGHSADASLCPFLPDHGYRPLLPPESELTIRGVLDNWPWDLRG